MEPDDLRIALFSGNYNYVLDGANQALNRLVGYLLSQGAQVRVYSPTVENPAFPRDRRNRPRARRSASPAAPEYRIPMALTGRVRRDLAAVRPQRHPCLQPRHRRSPRGQLGAAAQNPGRRVGPHPLRNLSRILSSASCLSRWCVAIMRRFYRRCDAMLVPAESTAAILRAQRMNRDISIWSRGVDRAPVQSRPPRHGMAPQRTASPTTKWSSPSSAGW